MAPEIRKAQEGPDERRMERKISTTHLDITDFFDMD